jgi:serine/threonine-protein kinase
VLGTLLAAAPAARPPSARAAADALSEAARQDARDYDLHAEPDRVTEEFTPIRDADATQEHTRRTEVYGTGDAAGRPAGTPPAAKGLGPAAGFWTAGGGGFVHPAGNDADTADTANLSRPTVPAAPLGRLAGHPGMSQATGPVPVVDPADASTGPLPYVPWTRPGSEHGHIPAGSGAPGPGGGFAREDHRKRTWLAVAATTGVFLIAGLGGWALTSGTGDGTSGGGELQVAMPGIGDRDVPDTDPTSGGLPTDIAGTAVPRIGGQNGQPISVPAPVPSSQPSVVPPPVPAPLSPTPTVTNSPRPTRGPVPGVVGMSLAAARKAITDAGFVEPTSSTGCQSGASAGAVYSQIPNAGRTTSFSSAISLYVQKNDCADVPEVTGQLVPNAIATLQNAGFTVAASPASCQYGTGSVRSMFPWGGWSWSKSDTVSLSVKCPDPPPPPPPPPTK